MRRVNRFIYSVIGIFLLVVLPGFFIVSNYMEKQVHGKEYTVTGLSGRAAVQYQISRPISKEQASSMQYRGKSEWIPLQPGAKIGNGALIKVDASAFVDIMNSDDWVLRLKENTLMKLEWLQTAKRVDATLINGRVLCRVTTSESGASSQGLERFRVLTPGAIARVRGTSFLVDYISESKTTKVGVLEGRVAVESNQIPKMDFSISKGEQMLIAPSGSAPVLADLTPELLNDLDAARNLPMSFSLTQRWENLVSMAVHSPLYHKAVAEIARYEMKSFVRAIHLFAPLKWQNCVPNLLKSVELEDGDYIDPWGTPYFYEKLNAAAAILVSAGSDKILHTNDDIFMNIDLGN